MTAGQNFHNRLFCLPLGMSPITLRPMKVGSLLCLCVLPLAFGLLDGCASNNSGSAAANSATQKKGHWVTLPPETGSWITRRVWVDDGGQTNAPPSMNNVHTGSAADLQRMQGPGRTGLPPGS